MAERYEAVAVRRYEDRDGNEKSSFTNIGVAFPMKERDGYTLRLHAMPAPVDGEYSILLMPPRPKDDQQERPQQRDQRGGYGQQSSGRERPRDDVRNQGGGFSRDLDDDIPF